MWRFTILLSLGINGKLFLTLQLICSKSSLVGVNLISIYYGEAAIPPRLEVLLSQVSDITLGFQSIWTLQTHIIEVTFLKNVFSSIK